MYVMYMYITSMCLFKGFCGCIVVVLCCCGRAVVYMRLRVCVRLCTEVYWNVYPNACFGNLKAINNLFC